MAEPIPLSPTAKPAGIATLSAAAVLPEPWYADTRATLDCELCGALAAELWPLGHYPPDPDWDLDDGELCICRRCADAIRPPARPPHATTPAHDQEER